MGRRPEGPFLSPSRGVSEGSLGACVPRKDKKKRVWEDEKKGIGLNETASTHLAKI